jgi:hypothetical protein
MGMLLALAVSGSCVNTQYPIERYTCGVNINRSYYNLTSFESRPGEHYHDVRSNLRLHVRMCGGFQAGEIPAEFHNASSYSVIACSGDGLTCVPLASRFGQDYRPLDDNNPSAGVMVEFHSEYPTVYHDYSDWIQYFRIGCDSNQHNATIPFVPRSELVHDVHRLSYQFAHSAGCPDPKHSATPAPTPTLEVQCQFKSRRLRANETGVDVDLAALNAGPGGIIQNFDDFVLFYQPCERINCPARGGNCDTAIDWQWGLSSMWQCTPNLTVCEDYGAISQTTFIDGNVNSADPTINVTMYASGMTKKASQVIYHCDPNILPGHVNLSRASVSADDRMTVHAYAKSACIQNLPEPIPTDPQFCYFSTLDSSGLRVQFNASVDNSARGYQKEIRVNREGDNARNLYFQSCRGMYCPARSYCEQHEDAYVWLCDPSDKFGNYEQRCQAYGLFGQPIKMSWHSDVDESGVMFSYESGDGLRADVLFVCDWFMDSGTLLLAPDGHGALSPDAQLLMFRVYTRDVCPKGSPSPEPLPFAPPTPRPPRATSAPSVSPPSVLFLDVGDQYIMLNMSKLDRAIKVLNHSLVYGADSLQFTVFRRELTKLPCPVGHDCDIYTDASWWGCWSNRTGSPVCYPIAEASHGLWMSLPGVEADSGVRVHYEGYNNIGTELRIYCDPVDLSPSSMQLDSKVQFFIGLREASYNFTATSGLVCPLSYIVPQAPVATPSPAPGTEYEKGNQALFRQNFGTEEKGFSLDLTLIGDARARLAVGSDQFYEHLDIVVNPVVRRSCPSEYNCAGMEEANVWKCWTGQDEPRCIPIGDMRYGFGVTPVDESDLALGIRVSYLGGLGGYATHVILTCNDSLTEEAEILLDRLGHRAYPAKVVTFYAQTMQVCPGHILLWRDDPTFSAVFVVVVHVAFVLYLVIGMIVATCREGEVALPNHEFWNRFWKEVKFALLCIFTCRTLGLRNSDNFDARSQTCENLT